MEREGEMRKERRNKGMGEDGKTMKVGGAWGVETRLEVQGIWEV